MNNKKIGFDYVIKALVNFMCSWYYKCNIISTKNVTLIQIAFK